MTESNKMTLWRPDGEATLPAAAGTANAIVPYALQLSPKLQQQIVAAFEGGHYEMGLNFLWSKTVSSLKQELATVGIELLGEMLGKTDVHEEDDVEDVMTTRDAIRLAGELGVVSQTDALRLRHTHEFVAHFSRLDLEEEELEAIDESEALASLKACVKSVLARPKVEVARQFVEFRKALESEVFSSSDDEIRGLVSSPYFFLKLTVNILMNSARNEVGARLEHCLSNTNVLLPELWPNLRAPEKWRVGHTYAEVCAEGKKTSVGGLRQALLKVKGFDFVPENLRSNTFLAVANEVLRAHDGMNNFYTELAPVKKLDRLGTSIPNPAFPACTTALLSVFMGNLYGVSWAASAVAKDMLKKVSGDRWRFYLDEVLPSDVRILSKLEEDGPRKQWVRAVELYEWSGVSVRNEAVVRLLEATAQRRDGDIQKIARALGSKYYAG